jgi:RNAse (barnase) inhibitor barstar
MERIYLNAEEISTKEKMAGYMKEAFRFPDYFGGNLDALNDLLSEVYEDTQICLTRSNLEKICGNSYAYRTLTVLGAAAAENPHLAILFVQ